MLGQLVPAQVAGLTKGVVNSMTAPAQMALHAVGSNAMDPVVDAIDQEYRQNWQTSPASEAIGSALPTIAMSGAQLLAKAPSAIQKALTYWRGLGNVKKAAITGAVLTPALTPETNVKSGEDFAQRKLMESGVGALAGGAGAGVAKLANRAFQKGESMATEAVAKWFKDKVPGKASDVFKADLEAVARARGIDISKLCLEYVIDRFTADYKQILYLQSNGSVPLRDLLKRS